MKIVVFTGDKEPMTEILSKATERFSIDLVCFEYTCKMPACIHTHILINLDIDIDIDSIHLICI